MVGPSLRMKEKIRVPPPPGHNWASTKENLSYWLATGYASLCSLVKIQRKMGAFTSQYFPQSL